MPFLSYFVVMGFVLTTALILISSQMKPETPAVTTSQISGLQKPFMPEQEPSPYRITATNFAAPRVSPTDAFARANDESKRKRAAHAPQNRPHDDNRDVRPAWRRIADNPIGAMMAIH